MREPAVQGTAPAVAKSPPQGSEVAPRPTIYSQTQIKLLGIPTLKLAENLYLGSEGSVITVINSVINFFYLENKYISGGVQL